MTRYGIVRRSDGYWLVGGAGDPGRLVWTDRVQDAQRFDGLSIATLALLMGVPDTIHCRVEPIAEPPEAA